MEAFIILVLVVVAVTMVEEAQAFKALILVLEEVVRALLADAQRSVPSLIILESPGQLILSHCLEELLPVATSQE